MILTERRVVSAKVYSPFSGDGQFLIYKLLMKVYSVCCLVRVLGWWRLLRGCISVFGWLH